MGDEGERVIANPAYRVFVSYIDKSREFYGAHGYENPYRWARNDDAPFTPLQKPLSESRVGLITTTTLVGRHAGDPDEIDPDERPVKEPYAAPLEPIPERMYTMDLSWDKEATHTRDLDSFFPVHRLQELQAEGRIGSIAPRFYGIPTEYSQRRTRDEDAPKLVEYLREDGVDVAILVPL
jgi:D-proline reductase (dithiol) PrdB